jgi:catalase
MGAGSGDLYEEIVEAISDIYGRHEGMRAVHAKGRLCAATFTATPEAADLSRAAHLQGDAIRAHVRFSNGAGVPHGRDTENDGRGFSVKFYLPNGGTTDIVALTLPIFFVRTPEDFLAFTRARKPDPESGKPDMEKIGAYLEKHPEALPAIQFQLGSPPPASYLSLRYHAIHAYRFEDVEGNARFGRYHWEPEAGVEQLERDDLENLGDDYLQDDLADRLEKGPAGFRLEVELAEEGDPTNDPTAAWPEDRERVVIGRLEITGLANDREQGDDILVMDPTRVTDGIECSDDPILDARSKAYSVSVQRRSGVGREAMPTPASA